MKDEKKVLKVNNITVISYLIILAITLIYAFTLRRHGLEIQNDSCSYIRGALSINKGLGYTSGGQYINHFPAGMSIFYALISTTFHITIYKTALVCHLFWIAGLGFIFFHMMRTFNIAEPLQPLGIILFLFSTPISTISAQLLTELPSAFILALSNLILFQFIKEKGPRYQLWLIGFLLGIGILFRFAVIGFLGGFMLALLLNGKRDWRNGIINAFTIVLPAVLLVFSYSTYVKWKYHTESVDRILLWHPIPLRNVFHFFRTPLTWLINVDYNSPRTFIILLISTGLLMVGLVILIIKNKERGSTQKWVTEHLSLLKVIIIIGLIYCLFLIVSISLFDAATPLNTRILSPLSIYFYLLIIVLFHFLYQKNKSKKWAWVGILGLCITLSWTAKQALQARYLYPRGYNKPYWQHDAKTIVCDTQGVWIRNNRTIFTNAFPFWRLMNDRLTIKIPDRVYNVKQLKNNHLQEQLISIREAIAHDSAQLVYFFDISQPPNRIPKHILFSYFNDSSRFSFIPFKKGLIIQSKKMNSNSTVNIGHEKIKKR